MNDEGKPNLFETVALVCDAASGPSTSARLEVLELAWLLLASNARTEALIVPGGFPEEKARQLQHLRRMADLVGADEPDLEMERLFHEGDVAGVIRRVQELAEELEDGREASLESD